MLFRLNCFQRRANTNAHQRESVDYDRVRRSLTEISSETAAATTAAAASDGLSIDVALARSSSSAGSSASASSSPRPLCEDCGFCFTIFKRQHHCRLCNVLCCDDCSKKRVIIDGAQVMSIRSNICGRVDTHTHSSCCNIMNRCAAVTVAIIYAQRDKSK